MSHYCTYGSLRSIQRSDRTECGEHCAHGFDAQTARTQQHVNTASLVTAKRTAPQRAGRHFDLVLPSHEEPAQIRSKVAPTVVAGRSLTVVALLIDITPQLRPGASHSPSAEPWPRGAAQTVGAVQSVTSCGSRGNHPGVGLLAALLSPFPCGRSAVVEASGVTTHTFCRRALANDDSLHDNT